MLPDNLACPIDGSPLQAVDGAALRCASGHSFDRAREGYYNLLAVQHKASRDPGDSKAMVAARRRFLEAGYYAPVADLLTKQVLEISGRADEAKAFTVLDAGCGEGYYVAAIARAAASRDQPRLQLSGIDISKWAARAAAKRGTACFWAVATNRHLPFAPGSIDLIVSMFGFPLWDAFAAVQSENGCVLLADPGPDHLRELRAVIYPEVRPTAPPSLAAALQTGYRVDDERRVAFQVALASAAAIGDLMTMTPHDHRAPMSGRTALAQLDHLMVTGDVVVRTLRRRSG